MKTTNDDTNTRPYRQTARAAAAEATASRILDAFVGHLAHRWFDEITLEMVARDADVTVQTVIRRFGNKEGLLEAACRVIDAQFATRDAPPTTDLAGFITAAIAEYEAAGPLVLRLLAQEDRYAAIRALNNFGRAQHRQRMNRLFEPWLSPLEEPARTARLDALVVAADVYVWKLMRIDMKRSIADLHRQMHLMIAAALGIDPKSPLIFPDKE
jgi:AcrR family transcriptional regulator